MRRSAPMRRTPLKRTAMKRRPSKRPAMAPVEYETVMNRAQGRCEGRVAPDCKRVPEQWHHRQSRSVGGHQASNGLGACEPCHRWFHANPERARELGLIVSRHHPNPAEVPVLIGGKWWLLDDHGGKTPTAGGDAAC